ncbi:TRAM domain-containing protein [Mycobacterium malmoense]|uniref:23S rRNA methyltransferase n=1 Tax=Mycobacterium malmoense TaxID=1780 RepID=A0ABX3SVN2_MYCMA|nr:TRAM domain-containing protein [Mycobacterium malmoense]OIN80602.1 23S rRNA methyltransferase [Mycobacterium malmoense]ORA84283.1 23S rRNA methyltransferase [Mycobacterium malmoense]QZA19983.1 TRAM domain-containing protein [Mycobacterium malmoense]UNB96733.1 class I SAM-dependent RNA methyltransferase [Mycobacterium malmoense]
MAPADDELTVVTGAPANGGSCVAHHDGRVVFVRHALPGERVRVRVTADRGSYWHAEVLEVIEPSDERIPSLCPIAGVDGAGCCDLAFVVPEAARVLKAQVVANQLQRLGGHRWGGPGTGAEPLSDSGPTGWRTRVRLDVGADRRPGFHRYHSDELVTDLRCAQLPAGMLDGLAEACSKADWPAATQLHVALDDDGERHVVRTLRQRNRTATEVVEGSYEAVQRVGARGWRVPVTAFWQAHRDAARVYSGLVADWAQPGAGMTVWDLYGGAGVFAAALGEAVGETGRVLTVDTSRAATRAARAALADLPQIDVVTDSVRRALTAQRAGASRADVAVLDPPRTGAGRDVIDLLAAAGVPRVVHIGCEAASFARDIGLYRGHGYTVEKLRVFDAFPLTHHTECVALLTR